VLNFRLASRKKTSGFLILQSGSTPDLRQGVP